MTRDEFERLGNYSCSLPTGTIAGKVWRRAQDYYRQDIDAGDQWWRGEYGEPYPEGHQYFGQIPIKWRKIVVEGTPLRDKLWLSRPKT